MVSYQAEHKKIDLTLFIQPLGMEKAQHTVFFFSLTYTPDKLLVQYNMIQQCLRFITESAETVIFS